jgi:hypothetical protein
MVMFATVPCRLTSTVIGANARPLSSARRSSCAIAVRIAREFMFGAWTMTFAVTPCPGMSDASARTS